jgi:hypothetical protein
MFLSSATKLFSPVFQGSKSFLDLLLRPDLFLRPAEFLKTLRGSTYDLRNSEEGWIRMGITMR